MHLPHGMHAAENCATCTLREPGSFCNLRSAPFLSLNKLIYTAAYPKDAVLFLEGEAASGLFVLCQGQVKLSMSRRDGKTLIMRIAEAGEVLGLAAAVSGKPYELTAETQGDCQVSFVPREVLRRLMREHGELALRVTEHLSRSFSTACREIRAVMSHSAAQKLAKLLLESSNRNRDTREVCRLRWALTHEEMAQMIGTSRETVTRLFADFKKKRLIRGNGSTLVIRKRSGLETMTAA